MTHKDARIVKWLRYALFLGFLTTPGLAQDTPAWEFFGGYSVEKADVRGYYKSTPIIYAIRNQQDTLRGWDVSLTENRNRWLGGTVDISGHYNKLPLLGTTNRGRIYSVMYGPRFSYRTRWVIPFTHLLFGAAQAKVKVTPTGPHDSQFSFAMAAGAGVDVRLGKIVAVRLIKAEYMWTKVLGTQQDRFRASAGLIFYWGKN